MTITIPDGLVTALVNTGIFLMCAAVGIILLSAIAGYFYSKEMNRTRETPLQVRERHRKEFLAEQEKANLSK